MIKIDTSAWKSATANTLKITTQIHGKHQYEYIRKTAVHLDSKQQHKYTEKVSVIGQKTVTQIRQITHRACFLEVPPLGDGELCM